MQPVEMMAEYFRTKEHLEAETQLRTFLEMANEEYCLMTGIFALCVVCEGCDFPPQAHNHYTMKSENFLPP